MTQHVLIIGGGPAGIEAARAVVEGGGQATLVSDRPIGGRAGWDSLLPSKVWLTAAARRGHTADAPAVVRHLVQVKEAWTGRQASDLAALGVELIEGTAAFVAPDTVEITHGETRARRQADHFIVATGSAPWFPEGLNPDGRRVLAPRFASRMETLPTSAVVIGSGPTGCEFAYLFNTLGTRVTWIVDAFGVLPAFHQDAGEALGAALVEDGVTMIAGRAATHIERGEEGIVVTVDDGSEYPAGIAFVATGRRPDWGRLNLSAAGLDPADGAVVVDAYGRTENPAIFLVGDADGGMMVANKAMTQARIAARRALGLPVRPFDPDRVLLAIYTEPQVAQIGQVAGVGIVARRVDYAAGLKAHLEAASGFVTLTYDEEDGNLAGAVAVGPHAAEVLAPVAVALALEATIEEFADLYMAHPTYTELAFLAARQ